MPLFGTEEYVAARMAGYMIEPRDDEYRLVVHVEICDSPGRWWKNEEIVRHMLLHEVGHAIYRAYAETRHFFNIIIVERKEESALLQIIKKMYPEYLWAEELFAEKFATAMTGIYLHKVQVDTNILYEIPGKVFASWVKF